MLVREVLVQQLQRTDFRFIELDCFRGLGVGLRGLEFILEALVQLQQLLHSQFQLLIVFSVEFHAIVFW